MTTRLTKPPAKPEPEPEATPALLMPNYFSIKPTDKLALAVIRAWIGEAYMEGVNQEKIVKAIDHYNQIMAWQAANPDKVKVPD